MGLNRISWKRKRVATSINGRIPLPMGLNRISWKPIVEDILLIRVSGIVPTDGFKSD